MDPRVQEMLNIAQDGFMTFTTYTGYEHLSVEVSNDIIKAIRADSSKGMKDKVTATADALNEEYTENRNTSGYAVLLDDFYEAETAQFMANILQETKVGDFSLITHTGEKNGVANMQGAAGMIYKGGITFNEILTINAKRTMHVTTIELTGAEVRTLLEQGKGLYENECEAMKGKIEFAENADELPHEYFEYYWSGIDVTMKNGKVISMMLNGKPLSDTETYSVVFAELDYPRAYKDKAVVTELLVQDAMLAYFEVHQEINAPKVLRE